MLAVAFQSRTGKPKQHQQRLSALAAKNASVAHDLGEDAAPGPVKQEPTQ
jgi:hypothetical protein